MQRLRLEFHRFSTVLVMLIAAVCLPADEQSPFSVLLSPAFALPLAGSADLFDPGAAVSLAAEYTLGSSGAMIRPFLAAGGEYAYLPVKDGTSLSLVSAEAGGGVFLHFSPRFSLRASAGGGYWYGVLADGGASASSPTLQAGAALSYLFTPALSLSLGSSYRRHLGVYQGLAFSLGSVVYLAGREERRVAIERSLPIRAELLAGARQHRVGTGVELEKVELAEIFPVFRSWYDERPLGRAVLVNREKTPVADIRLTFYMKQFMDGPKDCPAPARLGPGESVTVDVTSLFTERILEVTESTKASAELVLEYRLGTELYRDVRNLTVRLLDRNAMNWSDDRRAAAFVTAKDPRVLAFAKNTTGLVREKGPQAVDPAILTAMAIFKTMDIYGLNYVVDPKTPFVEFSKSTGSVDYLQFPRQTLEYRAGDCDDLSILYAALLESVGIETAFITVPGHIYMAFATEMNPAEASRGLTNTADLIIRDGRVWMPVEVTIRRDGFIRAWQEGGRQWREAVSKGAAGFHPIHDAWGEYEPVGLPGTGAELTLPSSDSILAAFLAEAVKFVDREILPKITLLEEEVRRAGGSPASRNRLGVLYARYGRLEQAEKEFSGALERGDYLPALLNLGNLLFMQKEFPRALLVYQRAARLEPDSPAVILAQSRVHHEMEKYDLARKGYERLAAMDPALAARFAYLGSTDDGAGRAEAAGVKRGVIVWSEE
jgi:tetratricopeptide (TPR) repeat protein